VYNALSYDLTTYLFAGALFLVVALLFCLIVSLYMLSKTRKEQTVQKHNMLSYESELSLQRENVTRMEQRNVFLERENKRLTPYANTPHVFAAAKQRRESADNYFLKVTQEANNAINQAKSDADTLIAESRKQMGEKNEVARLVLRQTRERADAIINEATLQAEQIAGDAWAAKGRLAFYQRTATAMKNKVMGYGDEYLVPNETLLDELSEQYDNEHASKRLKRVREQIDSMIRNGQAADSDYEDGPRKQRSIALVLDAFNGKAETILAKVDADNYGKMSAMLENAYELVNFNGKLFKNARIMPKYADLYQAQLRYAIQIRELEIRDKEEQRQIKVDMREQS